MEKRVSKKKRESLAASIIEAEIVKKAIEPNKEDRECMPDSPEEQKAKADLDKAQKQAVEEMRIERLHRFYDALPDKAGNLKIEIDIASVLEILQELGYCRYDQPDGTIDYVHIQDCRIRLIKNQQEIIDAFEDYVTNLPDRKYNYIIRYTKDGDAVWGDEVITGDKLRRKLFKNIGYYFSCLGRLRPQREITIMHDTYKNKYIYYNNGVMQINAKGTRFWSYDSIAQMVIESGEDNGEYIWEHDILKRDFTQQDKIGDFQQFCMYICGLTGKPNKESVDRFMSLQSIFGYLLHDEFANVNLKTILFIDVNKNHVGKPAGGTGKGIIGKAIGWMANSEDSDKKYISIGGKGFDPKFDRRYSEGDQTTKIVHIEDIAKDFDFEDFFNDVTDKAEFRKAGGNSTRHHIKTMLSSNSPIDTSAPSFKRRLIVFELDNYFNANRTPVDVFGKWFFSKQWNEMDWAQFDTFMIKCCHYYMSTKDTIKEDGKVFGIQEPPLINYKQQLLRTKLSEDFIAWFADWINNAVIEMRTVEYVKNTLYEAFSKKYTEYSSRERYARAFTKWCKFYLETMEIPSGEKRSTQDLLILYPPLDDDKIDYIYK